MEAATRFQNSMNLCEQVTHPQVSRCPLQGNHIEMIVRERQHMYIADIAANFQATLLRTLASNLLHRRAAIDGMHFETGLAFEQRYADSISASTHVKHPLAGLQLDKGHEITPEPAPEPKTGDVVGTIVIRGNIDENIMQIIFPDRSEAVLAELFASC